MASRAENRKSLLRKKTGLVENDLYLEKGGEL